MNELTPTEPKALATAEPSVALMLQTMVEKGITGEGVAAFSQLCALKERMEEKQAERDFAAALVNLQGDTIRIKATRAVDEKADGSCRYRFAPYEEIMAVVQPMLTRHGFSITFDTKIEETRLSSICTLMHKGGHFRSNSFAVRYGKPPGSSEAQGDMSTKSYAKRGALCDALNITIDHDDDARALGSPIDKKIANELRERVVNVKADEAAFLKFAGAANYEGIPAERYETLDNMLYKKEVKAGLRDEDGNWKNF